MPSKLNRKDLVQWCVAGLQPLKRAVGPGLRPVPVCHSGLRKHFPRLLSLPACFPFLRFFPFFFPLLFPILSFNKSYAHINHRRRKQSDTPVTLRLRAKGVAGWRTDISRVVTNSDTAVAFIRMLMKPWAEKKAETASYQWQPWSLNYKKEWEKCGRADVKIFFFLFKNQSKTKQIKNPLRYIQVLSPGIPYSFFQGSFSVVVLWMFAYLLAYLKIS